MAEVILEMVRPLFGINQTLMSHDYQECNYQWFDVHYVLGICKERPVIISSLCKKCTLLNIGINNRCTI
jgi:hypothetical protein